MKAGLDLTILLIFLLSHVDLGNFKDAVRASHTIVPEFGTIAQHRDMTGLGVPPVTASRPCRVSSLIDGRISCRLRPTNRFIQTAIIQLQRRSVQDIFLQTPNDRPKRTTSNQSISNAPNQQVMPIMAMTSPPQKKTPHQLLEHQCAVYA